MKVSWNFCVQENVCWSSITALVWSAEDVLYLRTKLKLVGNLVGILCTNHSPMLQKGLPMLLNSTQCLLLCALGILEPPSGSIHVEPEVLCRTLVLKDLLSKNYYISSASPNFGADFLIYKEDPFVVHADAIVHVSTPDAPILVKDWIASMRLSTNTKKVWIMAVVDLPLVLSPITYNESLDYLLKTDLNIRYCTMTWTGMKK